MQQWTADTLHYGADPYRAHWELSSRRRPGILYRACFSYTPGGVQLGYFFNTHLSLVEGCFWGIHSHDFLPYLHGAQERTADREWWVLEVGTIGIFQNSKY